MKGRVEIEDTHTHTHSNTHFFRLTLGFGTDEAGRRVAEGAQDGSDGQAQVLVARVERHRSEAEVRQFRGFFWADLHVRDLRETGEEEENIEELGLQT